MGRPKGLILFLRQVWKYTFSPPALIDNQRVNEDQSLEEDFVFKGALGMWIFNSGVRTNVLYAHVYARGHLKLNYF